MPLSLRQVALATSCLVPGFAAGDRFLDIPTASKLPFQEYRLEYADEISAGRTQLGYLDMGIGTSIEGSIRTEDLPHRGFTGTFDLTYNYISPLPDLSPGIALGVRDLPNLTHDGRRFFTCVTFRNDVEAIGGTYRSDITLGFFVGTRTTPFLGTSIPFSSNFRLLAEHDGIRLTAGAEFDPSRKLAFRLLLRGPDVMADLAWRGKF